MRLLRCFLLCQVIVGPRGAAAGDVEIKNRKCGGGETMALPCALQRRSVAA
jgi:prolyl-tRNA synthetase